MAEVASPRAMAVGQGRATALQGLTRLPVFKQIGLMLGLAASVALGIGIVQWSQTPRYSLLYGNLSGKGATEVMESLDRANIPYRVDDQSGALMVPSGQVHDARLKLAAEGLPRASDLGFEVLDKDQGFGTSQFIERARYQRALEVELARSISKVNSVQSARVHLAIPKQSVFVRNRKEPSASVLVHLFAGRRLEEHQVAAITHLVAASVPNMEPSGVKLVDQMGRMLTPSDQSDQMALTRKQFDLVRRVEASYVKRIEDILAPIVGSGGVKAQVAANMDFTRTEETRESFNPDKPALRSEQVLDENGSTPEVGGIPGALSNQPPAAGSAPEETQQEGQPPAAAGPLGSARSSRRRATRNFELDRTISHTRMPSAALERLSVAVVVDDHRVPEADGAVSRKSLTPEELERITGLVKEAIGYDKERGDSVNVVNAPFTAPPPAAPLPAPPLWEQAWLWDLAKQVFGAVLVLFVVFALLRPAMRRLTSHELSARKATAALPAAAGDGLADDRLSLAGTQDGARRLPGVAKGDDQMSAVRSMVAEDPKRVAQVVRNWVAEDG